MSVKHISSGSIFEEQIGYSRAVISDGWIFVSGTTGYDYDTMEMPQDAGRQCANTLKTIEKTLIEAGSDLNNIVRARYILPNRDDFEACWPHLRAAFSTAKPAATMIVAALMNPEMKIEIEVTARLPQR
ncbi:MAG: RidA family protein [Rhodobacteraceae bacterium]|nr:RidA family protein [Paracoccaceae bacterium]